MLCVLCIVNGGKIKILQKSAGSFKNSLGKVYSLPKKSIEKVHTFTKKSF